MGMDWFDFSPTRTGAIPFALDSEGNWRDVSDVERGLACNCACPECDGLVVAKKGEVRVHHFAHHDVRECRHALETSLFGMTAELLAAPGAVLQLPAYGNLTYWLREANIGRHITPPHPFASGPSLVPPTQIIAPGGFQIHSHRLSDSASSAADFTVPDHKLAVHVLSHRKPYTSLRETSHPSGWSVLALNLNHYVRLWWETCDPDKETWITQAMHARDQLNHWLAQEQGGRGFLQHSEEPVLRQKFDAWASEVRRTATPITNPTPPTWSSPARSAARATIKAEQAARAAAAKEMDAKWRIPVSLPDLAADAHVYQAIPDRMRGAIGSSLALELRLKWHMGLRTYVFVGRPGDVIPEATRRFIHPDATWIPITPTDHSA